MNVHVSYRIPKSSELDHKINQQTDKLARRLQVFRPDLVHLRVSFEEHSARGGVEVRLDLRLPSGDIAARHMAPHADVALRGAFDDLTEQIDKHKERLRAQHQWPNRRRATHPKPLPQVPFEDTIAAVHSEEISPEDISSYVDANLPRLRRFVDRELRYRENNGELRPNQLRPDEVIGEAIASALDHEQKPEKLALEGWLYRLSLRAIRDLTRRGSEDDGDIHLEQPARSSEPGLSEGSDESLLQFHHPDETVTAENLIPNRSASNPEESAASDEMIGMVELALRGTQPQDREAFLLFGIEGFTVDEISVISSRPVEEVRKSIQSARTHLRKNLPVPDDFKDKLLQHTNIA
jgi:RNA polymerase sigma factor (sigma-70 family)